MGASPILYLLVYCFIHLSSAVSAFLLMGIMKIIRKSERQERFKFSIILKYYFLMLIAMSVLMFIHTTTVLIIWRNDLQFPITPFFWTGIVDTAFMTVIPFTASILTLDKCLVLLLREKYNDSWTMIMFCTSILINITVATTNVVMYVIYYRSELPEGCVATGCLVSHFAQLVHLYSRTTGVVVNTIVGILFLIITAWLKKKQPVIGSRVKAIAEAVVFRAVLFGLLCDFLPHMISSVWNSFTEVNPFAYIGPYSRFIMGVDLLLNSIMNGVAFMKMRKKVSIVQVTATIRSHA